MLCTAETTEVSLRCEAMPTQNCRETVILPLDWLTPGFCCMQVKLQSQPRPLPGQQPQYAGALDAVRKVGTTNRECRITSISTECSFACDADSCRGRHDKPLPWNGCAFCDSSRVQCDSVRCKRSNGKHASSCRRCGSGSSCVLLQFVGAIPTPDSVNVG